MNASMARLRIEFQGVETVVPLNRDTVTVGRSNRADIALPDPALAPLHFRVDRKDGRFRLKDDGSGSGTRVNGRPVYAAGLNHGDEIEAGGLRCWFLEEDSPPPEPAEAPAPPRRAGGGSRAALYAAIGGGAIAVIAVLYVLSLGPSESDANDLWRRANDALRAATEQPASAAASLEAARDALAAIPEKSRVGRTAAATLAEVERALGEMRLVEESIGRLPGLPPAEADELMARLVAKKPGAHAAVAARIVEAEKAWRRGHEERVARQIADAEAAASAELSSRRFGEALRIWRDLKSSDYAVTSRAAKGVAEVEAAAEADYRALLRLAEKSESVDARIDLLEASRATFRGTPLAEDLEVRISSLRARRLERDMVTLEEPEKPKETPKPAPEPGAAEEPEAARPYADPPEVAALVAARRYAEAAGRLQELSKHPLAPVRLEELTLLAGLCADLVAAVKARPGEFTGIPLPHGVGRGDAAGADERELAIRTPAGETRYAWSALPAAAFPRLFRIAGIEAADRLAVGLFLDEAGLAEEAEQAYVAFFRGGRDLPAIQRVLARRRRVEGPFELFRDRLVAPSQKEEVLLRERIAKLGKQAASSDARTREEAFAELETLGGKAHATLLDALRARRKAVAEELESGRAFSPSHAVSVLGPMLEERRAEALRFILDPARYPYPNKSDAAQAEAERLVNLVRDVYDRPFDILKEKSETAREREEELKRLDERVAKLDPDDQPALAAAIEAIQRRLDMKRLPIDGKDRDRIEHNVAVESYNRALKGTTADEEERANVAAVNDYRWMMGLHALKIDERLVRGARKHSIEMRQLGYFAHESPTPALASPGHRARREGYGGGVGENIAQGPTTGQQAFDGWFHSSGHHRNMLMPGWTEMGCGQSGRAYWTQLFGALTGKSLDEPKVPPDPDPPGQSGNGRPPPE